MNDRPILPLWTAKDTPAGECRRTADQQRHPGEVMSAAQPVWLSYGVSQIIDPSDEFQPCRAQIALDLLPDRLASPEQLEVSIAGVVDAGLQSTMRWVTVD